MNMNWRKLKIFGKHRAVHEPPQLVLRYEVEREDDGRYLAEIMEIPGALAYGNTEGEAITPRPPLRSASSLNGSTKAKLPSSTVSRSRFSTCERLACLTSTSCARRP